jgi:hypothetical protein
LTAWVRVIPQVRLSLLQLALPLRHWGIAHSPLQKRHQVHSARLRHHAVFDNLPPLAEFTPAAPAQACLIGHLFGAFTPALVSRRGFPGVCIPARLSGRWYRTLLCRYPCAAPSSDSQCGFFRNYLLVICAAKPQYTAADVREHRIVMAPRLLTPGASATSPLHTPVLFEKYQRCVLVARIKVRCARCKWRLCRLTHSIPHARRCRRATAVQATATAFVLGAVSRGEAAL